MAKHLDSTSSRPVIAQDGAETAQSRDSHQVGFKLATIRMKRSGRTTPSSVSKFARFSENQLSQLPHDCLIEVLKFLPARDLARVSIRHRCRRSSDRCSFRKSITSSISWPRMTLSGDVSVITVGGIGNRRRRGHSPSKARPIGKPTTPIGSEEPSSASGLKKRRDDYDWIVLSVVGSQENLEAISLFNRRQVIKGMMTCLDDLRGSLAISYNYPIRWAKFLLKTGLQSSSFCRGILRILAQFHDDEKIKAMHLAAILPEILLPFAQLFEHWKNRYFDVHRETIENGVTPACEIWGNLMAMLLLMEKFCKFQLDKILTHPKVAPVLPWCKSAHLFYRLGQMQLFR